VTADGDASTPLLARRVRAMLVSIWLAAAGAAFAQALPATGPIPWSELNPAQRGVLAPGTRLETISPAQQQKWAELAKRFALPPEGAVGSSNGFQTGPACHLNTCSARLNARSAPAQPTSASSNGKFIVHCQSISAALAERSDPSKPTARASRNGEATVKSSVVRAPSQPPAQPVGPTVVKRGSGATTNLVSKPATPPLHQQTGLPKVAATPGFVDSATLLPQRGAQGAATRAPERDDEKPRKAQ
jgi:hypothetical protein